MVLNIQQIVQGVLDHLRQSSNSRHSSYIPSTPSLIANDERNASAHCLKILRKLKTNMG